MNMRNNERNQESWRKMFLSAIRFIVEHCCTTTASLFGLTDGFLLKWVWMFVCNFLITEILDSNNLINFLHQKTRNLLILLRREFDFCTKNSILIKIDPSNLMLIFHTLQIRKFLHTP